MREIKFRVWSKWYKKYISLEQCAKNAMIMPRDNKLKSVVNHELVLEQYTGLKDKNGVEIYEGDKMNFGPFNVNVYWNDKITGYYMKFEFDKYDMPLNYRTKEFEVIGNIHTEEKE